MTHDEFLYFRDIKNNSIFLYGGTIEEFENDLETDPDFYGRFDKTPIPFEEIDVAALRELLGAIMEDANWHTRASYEPWLIHDSLKNAGVDDTTAANVFRNFILGVEEQINS